MPTLSATAATATTAAQHVLSSLGYDTDFNSTAEKIPGTNGLQTIIGYTAWGVSALAVIGMLVTGALMAVSYHRGSNEHMGRLGSVAGGCVVIGSASSLGGALLGFNLFTSTPQAIPGLGEVQTIIGYTAYIAGGLCLIGLLATGGLMVIAHNRGSNEAMPRLGMVAAGCLVVGSASSLVGALI